jgi:hypothetical protein
MLFCSRCAKKLVGYARLGYTNIIKKLSNQYL